MNILTDHILLITTALFGLYQTVRAEHWKCQATKRAGTDIPGHPASSTPTTPTTAHPPVMRPGCEQKRLIERILSAP